MEAYLARQVSRLTPSKAIIEMLKQASIEAIMLVSKGEKVMWIRALNGDLINLNMVAAIGVMKNNVFNPEDTSYKVTACTGTSNYEIDVVNATLFRSPSEDECNAFMERLTALLSDKVLKI